MSSLRLQFASLSDERLLAQCEIDTYRASGPGGQKRNKTSSAVRLRHRPTELVVIAEESRSQHENKARALRRLRQAFFLKIREPVSEEARSSIAALRDRDGRFHAVSTRHTDYWVVVAVMLDCLEVHDGRVREAAEHLGTTTANLLSFLECDVKAWEQANVLRTKFGLKALRMSE